MYIYHHLASTQSIPKKESVMTCRQERKKEGNTLKTKTLFGFVDIYT